MRPIQFASVAVLVAAGLVSTTFAALAAPNAAMNRDSNVRATSSSGSEVVNFVEEDQEVQVLRCGSTRCKIKIPGPDGWVRMSYLDFFEDEEDEEEPAPPPAPTFPMVPTPASRDMSGATPSRATMSASPLTGAAPPPTRTPSRVRASIRAAPMAPTAASPGSSGVRPMWATSSASPANAAPRSSRRTSRARATASCRSPPRLSRSPPGGAFPTCRPPAGP